MYKYCHYYCTHLTTAMWSSTEGFFSIKHSIILIPNQTITKLFLWGVFFMYIYLAQFAICTFTIYILISVVIHPRLKSEFGNFPDEARWLSTWAATPGTLMLCWIQYLAPHPDQLMSCDSWTLTFSYFATATGKSCSGSMCMFGWWHITFGICHHLFCYLIIPLYFYPTVD